MTFIPFRQIHEQLDQGRLSCIRKAKSCIFLTAMTLSGFYTQTVFAEKCLFISSYHRGYAWSDGVEHGLRSVLNGKCEIKQFDMDTKRNKDEEYMIRKGLEAKQLIEEWGPDVVITADDNAAKFVIQPHFKDHEIPFVFCGINWTAEEYGFPYSNVTGMIEVAPIYPLLDKATELRPTSKKALYLGASTLTERKNATRFQNALMRKDIQLDSVLAASEREWLSAYKKAQNEYDFIIIGSRYGIDDWDHDRVITGINGVSQQLSVTNHDWMMPYTMLGFTKIPEEQGEWAAHATVNILEGTDPAEIAIVPNRKWDIWTNTSLLEASGISLPEGLVVKSKQVE